MTSQEFLRSIGACQPGIDSLGERRLKDSILTSPRGDWWYWVAATQAGKEGWPSRFALALSLQRCAFEIGANDQQLQSWLTEAARATSQEPFMALIRKSIDMISATGTAAGEESAQRDANLDDMASIFRRSFSPIPFLETLDK